MRRLVLDIAICMVCAALLASGPAAFADPGPRVVNVTPDSAPGWTPSVELEQRARKTALDFLAAKDSGRASDAYSMLANDTRALIPLADYLQQAASLRAKTGAVTERRIVAITWTKDSRSAPHPGLYVAVDLVSRFANVDRDCGYLILYQAPASDRFVVAREEEALFDNATARSMTPEQANAAWANVAAGCPNYPGVAPAPLPEQTGSSIGYPTVDAALADLHKRPGVTFSERNGWTVASDPATNTFWSFPPRGHPAYPAAVKRQLIQQGEAVSLQMSVLCGGPKAACDDLVRAFQQLNAQMSQALKAKAGG